MINKSHPNVRRPASWLVALTGAAIITCMAVGGENLGPELIKNGDMEQPGGWDKNNCGKSTLPKVLEIANVQKHGGDNSLHLVIERQEKDDYPNVSSSVFATDLNARYRIAFWYRVTQGAFIVSMRNGRDNDYVRLTKRNLVESGGWQLWEGEYVETAPGANARLCVFCADDGECEMFIDDVSVRALVP